MRCRNLLILSVAVVSSFSLVGCQAPYLASQAAGQARLMASAQSTASLRSSGRCSPSLLTTFDQFRRTVERQRDANSLDPFTEQALNVLTSSRLADALDLKKEDLPPVPRRERSGLEARRHGELCTIYAHVKVKLFVTLRAIMRRNWLFIYYEY